MRSGGRWHGARFPRATLWRCAGCAAILSSTIVRAQATPVRVSETRAPHDLAKLAPLDPDAPDRVASAIVIANAPPRSFRVLSIPVPADLAGARGVRYEVQSTGLASILGSKSGTVGAGTSGAGAVVLTIGVPASAMGGQARVALVRFTAEGRASIRVPIELQVAGIPRIDITPRRPMRGAQRGDRLELSFSIRNAGNVRDTIDLAVDAPASWTARFSEPPHVALEPGEFVERTVRITVPTMSDLGDFGVAIVATDRAGTQARGVTVVEVGDGLRPSVQNGPLVTAGVGSAATTRGQTNAVESVAIQGPLGDGVTVGGRISTPLPADPVASRALNMLGYSPRSDYLALNGSTWAATLGNSGIGLSELGGQTVFGRGGSLRLGSGSNDLRLFASAPNVAGNYSWNQSSLIAASASAKVGTSVLTAFLSHLRDSAYTVRELDAAGVGAELHPWNGGVLSGQVAGRAYNGGSGLGAAGVVHGPVAGGQLDVQLTHAPGGSAAFAVASDALTVSGERAFGRLRTEASYWATRDQSVASDELSSSGWSVSPAYPIVPTLTVASYLQGSTFASSGAEGRFASTQQDVGGRASLLHGGFELSADSRLSIVSREIGGGSPAMVNDDSRRLTNRLQLDHAGARGEIGVGGSMETSVVGAATMPSQTTVDAHVDRLQLFSRLPHLTFSGSMQRLRFGEATLTTSRLEANLDVQRSTRIVFGAERGTARDAAGVLQTVLTLKVERAAHLPSLGRRSATGVVFEDRNGNGVRDPGEPGVSGIVVRHGAQSSITDADGIFRVDQAGPGRTEIDPRSLPTGWLPSAQPLSGVIDEYSLGVTPTTALEVDVRLAGATDAGSLPVRVGRATLTLRDTAGRAWTLRTDEAARATFDALPAGRYTLSAELDESSEPLIVDSSPPIDITGAARRQHVTLVARTRPVRMFRGQP